MTAANTVKILINAPALIRIITFIWEKSGRLLESIVFGDVQFLVNIAAILLL